MILIIGGAFQGKTQYARNTFQIDESQITDGRSCGRDDIFHAVMVVHFHEYVRRFMTEETYLQELPERLMKENPNVVLVTNELGYGIVPMDAFDRAFREKTGRLCCMLAKEAGQVHRVVCGIGTVIKDA